MANVERVAAASVVKVVAVVVLHELVVCPIVDTLRAAEFSSGNGSIWGTNKERRERPTKKKGPSLLRPCS
jgi:hypothetical protein